VPRPQTPQEELLAAYRAYPAGERGVSEGAIRHYLRYARWFLDPCPESLGHLTAVSAISPSVQAFW